MTGRNLFRGRPQLGERALCDGTASMS
jgi:hypothetical protein